MFTVGGQLVETFEKLLARQRIGIQMRCGYHRDSLRAADNKVDTWCRSIDSHPALNNHSALDRRH